MSDQWQVRSKSADGRVRIHFEGPERHARTHVQNNFPRPHVEPGGNAERLYGDVQLHSPDGAVQEYHGDETGWVDIDDDGNIIEDDNTEVVE